MDEDGAAASGHSGPRIVIDLDDQVIEIIIAPEPVAWFSGRPPEGTIVAPTMWILAPGVVRANPANRQQCPRTQQAVGPPPQPYRMKPALWGAAVAFALGSPDAGAPQRDSNGQPADKQPTLRPAARLGANANGDKRIPSHTVAAPPVPDFQVPLALLVLNVLLRAERRGKVAATSRQAASDWRASAVGVGIDAEYA